MKDAPSSQYLTHKYPIWENCTFGEVGLVTLSILTVSTVVLFLLGLFVGHTSLMLLVLVPILFIGPKMGVKKLSQFKADKPYGYVMTRFRQKANALLPGLVSSPYVVRLGYWQPRKKLRRKARV